jgi:lactoylglutathione lyase
MPEARKARAVGFNHVALEVGDIDEALAFYGRLFEFKLRGKSKTSAFIDLGDQFIALQKGRRQPPDDGRHFGLVVDDKDTARRALAAAGVEPLPGPFLDFLDPWGNRIEIVGYDNIQFTCCAEWGSRISPRTTRRSRSSAKRVWPRADGVADNAGRGVMITPSTPPWPRRAPRCRRSPPRGPHRAAPPKWRCVSTPARGG